MQYHAAARLLDEFDHQSLNPHHLLQAVKAIDVHIGQADRVRVIGVQQSEGPADNHPPQQGLMAFSGTPLQPASHRLLQCSPGHLLPLQATVDGQGLGLRH